MGVEDKLRGWQVFYLVVLTFVTEEPQVLLDFLISMLHLPITLGMVCSRETCIYSELLVEFLH